MRTKIMILCIFLLLTGCNSGSSLKKGQLKYQITNDNQVILDGYLEQSEIESFLDIDLSESEATIIERINKGFIDDQVIVQSFKKKGSYGAFSILYNAPELLFIELNMTLDQYASTSYDDFDDMLKWSEFLNYSNGKEAESKDLESARYDSILIVNGHNEGVYYQVPGEILFISDETEYKKKGKDMLYIEPGYFGYIVYK